MGTTRASYLAVGQCEMRAALAESGEAELALALPAAAIERVRRNPRVDLRVVTVPRTRLVKLNAGHGFLDDPRERRAFSLAVDRAGMARAVLRNPAVAAGQIFPPALGGSHQPDLAPLGQDAAEARRLLAACGWSPGPDGILRDAADKRFAALLRTLLNWPEVASQRRRKRAFRSSFRAGCASASRSPPPRPRRRRCCWPTRRTRASTRRCATAWRSGCARRWPADARCWPSHMASDSPNSSVGG
jgi:hypothetical protein